MRTAIDVPVPEVRLRRFFCSPLWRSYPVLVALILVSIGFAVTLGMLLFGSDRAAVPTPTVRGELEDSSKARARAESDGREVEEPRRLHFNLGRG